MTEKLNDYELVSLAQEQNEEALYLLRKKYQPLIQKLSSKYYKTLKHILELSDIKQECSLALEIAIENFNEQKNICFYTFATNCMENQLITTTRSYNREKHRALNEAISIDNVSSEEDKSLLDYLEDNRQNPLLQTLENEEYQNLYNKIISNLSPLEESVVILRIQNFTYNEIANILDKDKKSIDNALQRIKYKIQANTLI